ncbi:MAG TPA: ATP-binding cassette domain-containing protein [Eoetvoesiella sp.]|uniref:branched-chain amino acid ABC transporter ATP-binding protein/permease n=1 Tax=Eoetvoesiella sp. TaxID=1966355 RepID=UPI002B85656A|nr:ATP-binding cassette domain-containing protein [Eoetvoesiella sp.]HWK62305.1 ATP-binding cassette domain-containing protein [Eoetvoesiella sp.]
MALFPVADARRGNAAVLASGLAPLAACLLAVPLLFGDFFAYELSLYLMYGIVAQGIALTWGRAGFLSLGQALFFGLGAYLAAFALKSQAGPAVQALLLLAAVLAPTALAYVIGVLVFMRRYESGPYFSLITLALVMFGYQLANQWSSVTGGFNGVGNIPVLFGLDRYTHHYYLVAAVCLASTALVAWLMRTPLGTLWAATAQNENRLQFFGFDTYRLKAVAWAVSAFLGALAGVLFASQQGLVTPQSSSVILSAELVIWTAVGGRAGPYGALLGAVAIGLLSTELREQFAYWEAIVAVVFIVVVLRFPEGVGGALMRLWRYSCKGFVRGAAKRAAYVPAVGGFGAAPQASFRRDGGGFALSISDVHVKQGPVRILNGLSLQAGRRGLHCLIGPNGAGKTSTFNMLTGRLPLARGSVRFNGRDVGGFGAPAMARLGVGRKFQIPSVFPELSVRDNLCIALWANRARGRALLGNSVRGWNTPTLEFMHRSFPFFAQTMDEPAGALSQGQRQMLEFAMTALAEPLLFLLDEPCAGLSVDETRHLGSVIAETVGRLDACALIVEHDMAAVEALADHVYVLHQGRLLAQGDYAQVRRNAEVQAVYAGGSK